MNQALDRVTHPEEGMVYACPHCNEADVRERKDGSNSDFDEDAPMACYSCHTGVYEPVERESKRRTMTPPENANNRGASHGSASTLESMEPHEFDSHLAEVGLR